MRTYLINLDRSSDRLSNFWTTNENLNIEVERFSAVDGSSLNIAELEASGTIDPIMARTYTPGAVGATLSHVALWERAIAAKERVTIVEDDAIFNFQYESSARDFLAALDEDWDFILWGWNFDAPLLFELIPDVSPCSASFDQASMVTRIKSFQRRKIKPSAFRLLRSFGTPCYSVSPRGARSQGRLFTHSNYDHVLSRFEQAHSQYGRRLHDECHLFQSQGIRCISATGCDEERDRQVSYST